MRGRGKDETLKGWKAPSVPRDENSRSEIPGCDLAWLTPKRDGILTPQTPPKTDETGSQERGPARAGSRCPGSPSSPGARDSGDEPHTIRGHTQPPGLAEPAMILEYHGDWNGLWCHCLVSSGGVYQKGASWQLEFYRVTAFSPGA